MASDQPALKKPAMVALAALAVLLVGSLIFFRERMLFADASYILLNILNTKAFFIQEHRYGSFITQIVPWLGQKLNLSIGAITIAYSASFNVFYLAVATVIYRLRQYGFVILMACYYLLFTSDSFFWTNNEIHQSVAWMFLLFSATLYLGSRKANIVLLLSAFLPLAFLTFFTHFAVIIPAVFLGVYLILEKEEWPFSYRIAGLLGGVVILIVAAKVFVTTNSTYDRSHLHRATHFSLSDIFHSFSRPAVTVFCHRVVTNYWPAFIVFIAGLRSLVARRKIKQATWCIVSLAGFFIITALTFADLEKNGSFHIESEWQSMSIIIATPFVCSFLPELRTKTVMWLLGGLFAMRIIYITAAARPFEWRVQFQNEVLAKMRSRNIHKLAIYNNEEVRAKYLSDWALTYETIISSAMDGDRPQYSFIFVNKDDKASLDGISDPHIFYNVWGMMAAGELNNKYFSIDTTHPYTIMTYEQLIAQ